MTPELQQYKVFIYNIQFFTLFPIDSSGVEWNVNILLGAPEFLQPYENVQHSNQNSWTLFLEGSPHYSAHSVFSQYYITNLLIRYSHDICILPEWSINTFCMMKPISLISYNTVISPFVPRPIWNVSVCWNLTFHFHSRFFFLFIQNTTRRMQSAVLPAWMWKKIGTAWLQIPWCNATSSQICLLENFVPTKL